MQQTKTGTRVVVVGAGIGGLTAAYELKRRGFNVTVVEESDHPGGRMTDVDDRSFKHKFTGATRFFPFYKDLWRLVDEFNLRTFVVPAPTDAVVKDGEFSHPYDMRFKQNLLFHRGLSWKTKIGLTRLGPDILRSYGRVDPQFIHTAAAFDDESIAEYLLRKVGRDFLEKIPGVAYRNLLAWNVEESSKAFFFLLFHHWRGQPQFTFRQGIGHLPRALAGQLDVRFGHRCLSVGLGSRVGERRVIVQRNGQSLTIDADIVIMAVPGNKVLDMVGNQASWERDFFQSVRYSQYFMMHYILKEEPKQWHHATFHPRSAFSPLSMLKTFRANSALPGDLPKLWAVLAPDRAEHYVGPSGANLDEVVRHYLREVSPDIEGQIVEAHEMHTGYINATFPTGQARRVCRFLSAQESGPKNIYYVGDYLANGTAGGACASGARTARIVENHWLSR